MLNNGLQTRQVKFKVTLVNCVPPSVDLDGSKNIKNPVQISSNQEYDIKAEVKYLSLSCKESLEKEVQFKEWKVIDTGRNVTLKSYPVSPIGSNAMEFSVHNTNLSSGIYSISLSMEWINSQSVEPLVFTFHSYVEIIESDLIAVMKISNDALYNHIYNVSILIFSEVYSFRLISVSEMLT